MAKRKPKNLTWWKKDAWKWFSRFIRARDAQRCFERGTVDTPDFVQCCTCKKVYPAFGKGCVQAGHYVPGRSHAVLFEENGVHSQCYNCNVTLKGNSIPYRRFMLEWYGEDETVRIENGFFDRTFKYTMSDLEEMRDKYKEAYEALIGD